ncbi:MAG: carboxypeptidase regulatory-like domain-containing protein, partial [Nitrospirae bacterium]|nr:carboxypeptidase regulatory-like domain-containing protein [Nitrospirota bacterium]
MPLSPGKTAKCLSGLFLVIVVSLIGCASGTTESNNSPGTKTGNITGKVVASSSIVFKIASQEALTGSVGVPGAVCTIEGTDKSATTDEQGTFTITDVPPGSYIVICKKTASDGKVFAFLKIAEVQPEQTADTGTIQITQTGAIQGKVTLTDRTDHAGIIVYLPGTSMQARTDATGAYLINDVPEGTYELRFEKSGYYTGKITDLPVTAGNTVLAENMTLNLSTGASGIVSIENGKVYSTSRTVTVYITASDDARLYQISDSPNFIGVVWNTIPTSRTWVFDSDGEKRLYTKFADANGLESAPASDSIIIDTTPPFNGSVSINNGALATNSTAVTLNLSATDATTSVAQTKISNTPDFVNTEWESFTSTRLWTIPAGDGTKTVYVLFRDIVGNETTQAISDDIILDTTTPASPYVTIQEGAYTTNTQIHLNLSASGATFMKISEDPTFAGVQPIPYTPTMTVALSGGDGNKTIYVKYFDDAGNESDLVSASVVLDTIPPATPVIFNQNQIANQTSFEMTLSTPSTDANFKTYQLKGGQYTDWTDTAETTTFSFTLTQQGANSLSIRGKDMAGNLSNEASVIITVDSVSPITSDITATATVTTATITWHTSEPTYGQVEFGLNQDYGSIQADSNFTTSHSVQLTGLLGNSLYHYRIISTDIADNVTTSTDLTFMTVKITAISGRGSHSCAITSSGVVKCWGFNRDGQIGDGSTTNRHAPVDVVGLSDGVIAVSAGGSGAHTCVLTAAGGVKCWGDNSFGQLGDGSPLNSYTPVDVVGLSSGIISITAGGSHTCALISSGGVKCWGANWSGQLGDGTTIY